MIEVKDYDGDLRLLVADNWLNDMDNNVPQKDGGSFLGKGGYKFAIKVRVYTVFCRAYTNALRDRLYTVASM